SVAEWVAKSRKMSRTRGQPDRIGPRSNCGPHRLIVRMRSLAAVDHRRAFLLVFARRVGVFPWCSNKTALRQRVVEGILRISAACGRAPGPVSLQFSPFQTEELEK